MSLKQLLTEMTHREFLMWLWFFEDDLENPSKTEQYLMQIAAEIRAGNVKNPRSVKMKDFHLRFKKPKPEQLSTTREQQAGLSKAMWRSRLGGRKQ